MACPPPLTRSTSRRSLATILRGWSRRAANDNEPFARHVWQPVTPDRAAQYYAAVAGVEAD